MSTRSFAVTGALVGLLSAACERSPERLEPLPASIVMLSEVAALSAPQARATPAPSEAEARRNAARSTAEGPQTDEARDDEPADNGGAPTIAYDEVEDWGDVWEEIQEAERSRQPVAGEDEPAPRTALPPPPPAEEAARELEGEPGGEAFAPEGEPGADALPPEGEPGAEGLPPEGEPGAEGLPPEGEPGAEALAPEGEQPLAPGSEEFPREGAEPLDESAELGAERERLRALEQQTAELREQIREEQQRTETLDANLSQALWVAMLVQRIRLLQMTLVLGQRGPQPLTGPPANPQAPPPPGAVSVPE